MLKLEKFDKKTELQFIENYNKSSIAYVRIAIIMAVIVNFLFSWLDYYQIPSHYKLVWNIRLFIWLPSLIIIYYLTFKPIFIKHFQLIISSQILSFGFGILFMIYIGEKSDLSFITYYAGIPLIMICIIIFRLRFYASTVIIIILNILYILIAVYKQKLLTIDGILDFEYLLYNNLIFMISFSFTYILASYILENYARNLFKQQLLTQQKNEELIQTLISKEERDLLLKEIHHRVKNNLQIIISLIRLQSEYITPNNFAEKISEIEHRIRAMALVHEKLYQSNELSKLNVENYIKELVSNIHNSINGDKLIKFTYDISPDKYHLDVLIPIGLIINEAITNTFKYAFNDKENAEIYIKFCSTSCENGKTVLNIKDNGIGSDTNFEELSSNSLGMELISTLVDQLDGEFNLDTSKGFNYYFTFSSLDDNQ
ncbi:MAG TPA: sensor histidine kinase [Crocinitomix sp.]|nr:sensor histidine kinase [Crocinitomix sp.]